MHILPCILQDYHPTATVTTATTMDEHGAAPFVCVTHLLPNMCDVLLVATPYLVWAAPLLDTALAPAPTLDSTGRCCL